MDVPGLSALLRRRGPAAASDIAATTVGQHQTLRKDAFGMPTTPVKSLTRLRSPHLTAPTHIAAALHTAPPIKVSYFLNDMPSGRTSKRADLTRRASAAGRQPASASHKTDARRTFRSLSGCRAGFRLLSLCVCSHVAQADASETCSCQNGMLCDVETASSRMVAGVTALTAAVLRARRSWTGVSALRRGEPCGTN